MNTTPMPADQAPTVHSADEQASPRRKRDTEEKNVNKPAEAAAESVAVDLSDPQWYLNRELTWLQFNSRVLHEAEDERTPLLERVKFLAIALANLDEFFMKRIGGLKQQIGANVHERSADGLSPGEQISACYLGVRDLLRRVQSVSEELQDALTAKGIRLLPYQTLSSVERESIDSYYRCNVFPLLTPLAIDPAHPFPFISNLSLNLLVSVRCHITDLSTLVRIKVPTGQGIQRFLKIEGSWSFVALEEVIAAHLDLLFPESRIEACDVFRVTRNAVVEQSEEAADDLLELIESEVRERRFAPIVRLEVSHGMPTEYRDKLAAELGLTAHDDVFTVEGFLAGRDLFEIANLDIPELHHVPHHPVDHIAFRDAANMFQVIRERNAILVHHPYESFSSSVERFLGEASRDPQVLAIKMTLYRTAHQSKIIDHLIEASQNGKHVAVAVELKARFDESANIRWANHLEEAGIHVSYGIVGLKTHSKLIFVLRQDYDGLRRYAHIGTGNYHAGTARIYCDLGLFTCDADIGTDLTELFNYLTSAQVPNRSYRKLLPAPTRLKHALLEKIEREIDHQRAGAQGLIRFKMNALEDVDITRALYQASRAGVKVRLLVRDTCRLRPGINGLSDNVEVVSIVGRFLEHARIYHFHNHGSDEYFIGSADCMTRNLESRVEVVTPVEAPELRALLDEILNVQLNDTRSAWEMLADGSYRQRTPMTSDVTGAQETLMHLVNLRQFPDKVTMTRSPNRAR